MCVFFLYSIVLMYTCPVELEYVLESHNDVVFDLVANYNRHQEFKALYENLFFVCVFLVPLLE